jgi:hypothetical protein
LRRIVSQPFGAIDHQPHKIECTRSKVVNFPAAIGADGIRPKKTLS